MRSSTRGCAIRIFNWIILPLCVFYLVSWLFNPAGYLFKKITDRIELQTGIRIAYSDVRMTLTGAISIHNPIVSTTAQIHASKNGNESNDTPKTLFTGDQLTLRVALNRLLQKTSSLHFRGTAYGGSFSGSIEAPLQKQVSRMQIHLLWESIDLARFTIDHPDLLLQTGICNGTANLTSDVTRMFGYSGPVNLTIANTRISSPESITGDFDLPDFTDVSARFTMDHEQIRLDDVRLNSSDTIVRVLGLIHQKMPADTSQLDLDVRIHMVSESQPFRDDMYFPVTVKGPVSEPDVFFLGKNLRKY